MRRVADNEYSHNKKKRGWGLKTADFKHPAHKARGCFPRNWKGVVRWFEEGRLRDGNPAEPHRMFQPPDDPIYACVINHQLKWQEPPDYVLNPTEQEKPIDFFL